MRFKIAIDMYTIRDKYGEINYRQFDFFCSNFRKDKKYPLHWLLLEKLKPTFKFFTVYSYPF